jgi:chemotaxis protein CheZ
LTDPDGTPENPLRAMLRVEIVPQFEQLRHFVDRRIAELSAEVHAAVQLVDFSEANLSSQIGRIHEQIDSLVAPPTASMRNSGFELEAVVQATESAANRILEAAEAIGDWLRQGRRDPAALEAVGKQVNVIFEACSFQDLTGQRIRRAIEHLRQVEDMLSEIMPEAQKAASPAATEGGTAPDLRQDDIDRLLA